MRTLLLLFTLLISSQSFAFKYLGVRCKDFPKHSCEAKKCKCLRGSHRAKKGKSVRKISKRGKMTLSGACAGLSTNGEAAWKLLLKKQKKLARKCR